MTTYLGTATSGTPAIEGDSSFANQPGVVGKNTSTTGSGGAGVEGTSTNAGVAGVYGFNAAGNGVHGNTTTGTGVYGQASATATAVKGVHSSNGNAVLGISSSGYGVLGQTSGAASAVRGENSGGSGHGVYGANSGGYGVYGTNSGNGAYGVYGTSAVGGWGVFGIASGSSGTGVSGNCDTGIGVYAGTNSGTALEAQSSGGGTAGSFIGNVNISGSLTKGSGTFLIDHPLDPTNKDLLHSFVESPEMKNIYDGEVLADGVGEATVEMPSYFDALNTDLRYQLTAVGSPAPALHVKAEMNNRHFVIAGANPLQKICWQVTGVRRDPYALAHPITVEREKPADEKGFYRHPREHGQPEAMGIAFMLRERRRLLHREGEAGEEQLQITARQ